MKIFEETNDATISTLVEEIIVTVVTTNGRYAARVQLSPQYTDGLTRTKLVKTFFQTVLTSMTSEHIEDTVV